MGAYAISSQTAGPRRGVAVAAPALPALRLEVLNPMTTTRCLAVLLLGVSGCAQHNTIRPDAVAPNERVAYICGNLRAEQPLVLFDGRELPCDDRMAVDDDEIERVIFLRGVDAVKVYGPRASHGAVLITLKKPHRP